MTTINVKKKNVVNDIYNALQNEAIGLGFHKIMHVCGTHEHEINRHGLRQLLPENIKLVAGPGCPVCITPASSIITAINFALLPEKPILCTYGDMVRVPTNKGSLLDSRGLGADIRVVYSVMDVIKIAHENPARKIVFFSVGFETTAAPVAALIRNGLPENLFVYACHRYVPNAVRALVTSESDAISGFLLPGHACVITGIKAYDFLSSEFGKASAVAGFEPEDILAAILSTVRQIKSGTYEVSNCYTRVVNPDGNKKAQEILFDVFSLENSDWRGIGNLPLTGLKLRGKYEKLDAVSHFGIHETEAEDIMKGCICHLVLTGRKNPDDCGHFGTGCTPDNPQGPCMVGSEGTCRSRYTYPERIIE